ncbi:traB domain-containing protein isoform X2 [Prorops nasuta]
MASDIVHTREGLIEDSTSQLPSEQFNLIALRVNPKDPQINNPSNYSATLTQINGATESQINIESNPIVDENYINVQNSHFKNEDDSFDNNLPETVTLLRTPDGGKLYLIGTAHFSIESQEDVAKVIRAVQPHSITVELCKARLPVLLLDEKSILQEAEFKGSKIAKIREVIKHDGLTYGLMYILMLSMSAQVTKELGMAPGGEFRKAFAEGQKIPNCEIQLGDRPINITIQRAIKSLSWWETIKFTWSILTTNKKITPEEVEKVKSRGVLEEVLAELTKEFASLERVFVKERDLYLTYSLQAACLPKLTPQGPVPARVVGIVGIGHTLGIIENWGKVKASDIKPILRIPPPSLSSKIIKFGFKATLLGSVVYVAYRLTPISISSTVTSVKSAFDGLLKVSGK